MGEASDDHFGAVPTEGRGFALFGVPSSAGAHWPGQERAPEALRSAGLTTALGSRIALDLGDLEKRVFEPDPRHRHARSSRAVHEVAERVATRVAGLGGEAPPFVIGGDCTVLLGVVAGVLRSSPEPVGLVYLDGHADLNTPATSPSGVLDSMGLAHLLGHGVATLTELGPRSPMLDEGHVALLGFNHGEMNPEERSALARHRCTAIPAEEVRSDPVEAARRAADVAATPGTFLVHFDVDVIDFSELPVADVPPFGGGLPLATVFTALQVLLSDRRCAGLVICEFNPDRDLDGAYARSFVERLSRALGCER